MVFLRDKESIYLRKGQELFFDRWMGYEIGKKIGFFVAASHFDNPAEELKAKIRNATCERMLRFNPHHITDEYMDGFAEKYIRYKPFMIKSFPNSLMAFAEYVKRKNIKLPKVRSISCTGENLYKQQKSLFEEVFHGEVFEKVGTRESGVFACECRQHNGMHVFTDGVYLEIIKDNGEHAQPGEMGHVVITDLFNRAMPLIRYDIGDMAVATDDRDCPCGCKLPKIEKLLGRTRDIIVDSDGNPKPGYLFTEIILHMNVDAQFQIIQPDRQNLVVRIAQKKISELEQQEINSSFQEIVGQDVNVSFEYPDRIERDPSGKYGYVVSKVKFGGDNGVE
jgi:phenylacetate-CoA ligase